MRFEQTVIYGALRGELNLRADRRGWLAELYRPEWFEDSDQLKTALPMMAYLSLTLPGYTRGPHEHRDQTDILIFPGPGDLELRMADRRKLSSTYGQELYVTVGESNPSAWIVPPGVIHGYRNCGSVTVPVLNFPNRLFKGWNRQDESVDEIRHEDSGLAFDAPRWTAAPAQAPLWQQE